ncbi:MAG TPA: outer membrane lipoprotein-sorting protein [Candidatus Acidoferrum sp.]|nr:outer membrane lipoprotein-sorting protein [Candidatus Acidoferrum sp.]
MHQIVSRGCCRTGLILLAAFALHAQDARQIMEESQKRTRANSQQYEGLLQVIEPSGKTTEKRWQSQRLGSFGNSKTMLRFTAPAEVKGVALLVMNHTDRAADEWMWTPAIGRERRIALQDRSTRFFGTDFTFEDLEERDVEQFDFKLLGDGEIDGAKCWKIESTPRKGKTSQYSLLQMWVRKDNYVTAQMDCYSKDQLVRRLKYQQIEDVQNIWTARVLEMSDLKRKSRTILKLEQLRYNVPLKDDEFTVAGLQREK